MRGGRHVGELLEHGDVLGAAVHCLGDQVCQAESRIGLLKAATKSRIKRLRKEVFCSLEDRIHFCRGQRLDSRCLIEVRHDQAQDASAIEWVSTIAINP